MKFKYIDTEKLKAIIKVQIKKLKEWVKGKNRSARQDQTRTSQLNIARHFYELGLKARKEI
jgi:hypothetical protein